MVDRRYDELHGESASAEAQIRQRYALIMALEEAEALIERNPDAAALLLDGLLNRILDQWLAQRHLERPEPAEMLAQIEQSAPPLAWRLRLALHAPDARARLIHCWELVAVVCAAGTNTPENTAGWHHLIAETITNV